MFIYNHANSLVVAMYCTFSRIAYYAVLYEIQRIMMIAVIKGLIVIL